MKFDSEITNRVTSTADSIIKKSPDRLYKAVMKGGGIVKAEAAGRAPSKKIGSAIKVIGKNSPDGPESRTGISRKSKAWYGKFFESGAKKHDIKAKKARYLSFAVAAGRAEFTIVRRKKTVTKIQNYYTTKSGEKTLEATESGNWIKAKIVHHPGMKEEPFLKPSYQGKKAEIQQVITDAMLKTAAEAIKENN